MSVFHLLLQGLQHFMLKNALLTALSLIFFLFAVFYPVFRKRVRNKALLLCAAAVMLMAVPSGAEEYDDAVASVTIGESAPVNYSTLQAAINAGNGGTVKLLADIDTPEKAGSWPLTVPSASSVTLDLNGKTIRADINDAVINITNNTSLTLTDGSTDKTGKIINANSNNFARGVAVNGGTFTVNSGTIESTPGKASGTYGVELIKGTYTMDGGTIIGWGAGVNMHNDSIYDGENTAAIFNMNGGSIKASTTGVNASSSMGAEGGYSDVVFTMTGGTISGNISDEEENGSGGGVYIGSGAEFNMTGGTISGNRWAKGYGAGVGVRGGIFNLSGGTITGNSAAKGGGIYVGYIDGLKADSRIFLMSSPDISDNSGGNVYLDLNAGKPYMISINGGLNPKNPIGITLGGDGTGVFTDSSDPTYNDKEVFFSEAENLYVGKNTGGQLLLGKEVKLTYNANTGEGSKLKETNVISGSAVTVLTAGEAGFEKGGRLFVKWNTASDGSGTSYDPADPDHNTITITEDSMLYAQWKANSYTVKFEKNGEDVTGTMADQSFTYDADPAALTENAYNRTGYLFSGWNTDPNGSGTPYPDKAKVQNLTDVPDGVFTLYAQWKPPKVSVLKLDAVSGDALAGATLQVTDMEGTVVKSWTSTENVDEIKGLIMGVTYSLHEEAAPAVYAAAADTTFMIDEDGKVITTNGELTDEGVLVIRDKRKITASADNVTVTHDGNAHSITLSIKDAVSGEDLNNAEVKFGTEAGTYTLDRSPAYTDMGEYTVYYQVSKENYETETGSAKVTIRNKYEIAVTANSSTGNVYDGTVFSTAGFTTLEFTVDGNTYTVSGLTSADPSGTNAGTYPNTVSGTAEVTDASGNDVTSQFIVKTKDGTREIVKRGITVSVENRTVTYNGSEQYGSSEYSFDGLVSGHTGTITYTPAKGSTVSGSPYDNGSFGNDLSITDGEGSAVTGNYSLTTMTPGKLTINKATLPAPAAPTVLTVSGNSITLVPTDGYEYSMNGSSWQESNIFTGLTTDTEYTFYQRVKGDSNHEPSAVSEASTAHTNVHVHEWTFTSESSGAITATCSNTDGGHSGVNPVTVTLVRPELTTYGGTGSAEVTFDGEIDGVIPEIVYSKDDGTVLDAAPTETGTYTATITFGEGDNQASASLKYTIDPAKNPALIVQTASVTKGGHTIDLSKNIINLPEGSTVTYVIGEDAKGCSVDENGLLTTGQESGEVTVTVTVTNSNYSKITGTITVTITEKNIVDLEISQDDVNYGQALKPPSFDPPAGDHTTVITYEGTTNEGIHYGPNETAPTEYGSYTVTVTCESRDTIWIGSASFFIVEPGALTVKLTNVKNDGSYGIPGNVRNQTLNVTILVKDGNTEVCKAENVKLTIKGGEKETAVTALFDRKAKLSSAYTITVKGLPETIAGDAFTSRDNAPKYRLTLTLWVMDEKTITGSLKWDDDSSGRNPEPVVYPLPEDEIGAYALRKDGTKEYLLFQTYDICMWYLGSEELCESNQRCYHK